MLWNSVRQGRRRLSDHIQSRDGSLGHIGIVCLLHSIVHGRRNRVWLQESICELGSYCRRAELSISIALTGPGLRLNRRLGGQRRKRPFFLGLATTNL